MYCSGTFVGQRVLDQSSDRAQTNEHQLKFTLCLTPTKGYPSLFGAGFYSTHVSILQGAYDGRTRAAQMTEMIDGVATYSYEYKLLEKQPEGAIYLHGTWKSLTSPSVSGQLIMVREEDVASEMISGVWLGQADPDEELRDFLLPINPIRWCLTLFRTAERMWRLFGCGYFNDSADIPNQPLLFFTLDGQGTLDDMKITKKYVTTNYFVEYRGRFSESDGSHWHFQGRWSNPVAGSYGSSAAKHYRLSPSVNYRLDLCICEVCGNVIYPGETRWACSPCHFSTCFGCHLNSVSTAHPHQLEIDLLPGQKIAQGTTSRQLIGHAFELFGSSPFVMFRSAQTNEFSTLTYSDMFTRILQLCKYWKPFVGNPSDAHRPMIVLICSTSPAYICCLLSGLLLQFVVVPINGSLHPDAIQHTLSTTAPLAIVIDEAFVKKVDPLLSPDQRKSVIVIHPCEQQFQLLTTSEDGYVSLTKALQLGNESSIDTQTSFSLSNTAISAILPTSGSTGYPKGAIFTEELLVPNDNFTLISPFIRLDYQPFDPVLVLSIMSTIRNGGARGLTNLRDMWEDIKLIRPTSLSLTPSLWNIIYKNYLSKIHDSAASIDNEHIIQQMRDELGGRVHVGTSGGGAISATVSTFIRKQLKIDLVDMYGCRECGSIAKNGVLYPGVSVKLLPIVADMSEFDGVHQGEICIHSPKMIQGYWGGSRPSCFVEIEGKTYYRTGDIGQLDGNTIKLLDRSGTMIKNSMGEWISPVYIENIIEQLAEISISFVVGHSSSSYLIAIVCLSESGATLNDIDMLQLIRFHCVQCGLSGPEIPQAVFIERDIVWSAQNGLLREKKCRHALAQHYSHVKMQMFSNECVHSISDETQLTQEFVQILETILNRSLKGHINGANTLVEIGADSLTVSLLSKIYHERGIPIRPAAFYSRSLSHLDQALTNKHRLSEQIVEEINWNSESRLPRHLQVLLSNFQRSRKANILVTGAVGFLGPILVAEIAQHSDPNALIYCLIRAKDDQHAEQRLENDLQKCQRWSALDWNRIRCLAGDVAKERFGLSADLYEKLTEEVGTVYHNASYVHLEMPYKALKGCNVQGTLNALEFALRCHARLVYSSSVAALPRSNDLTEDANGWVSLTAEQINEKDGYGQTKVVSEKLLRQAANLGADVVLVRPCSISADTQTGYTNLNDFINILLRVHVDLGTVVENANAELHFVPVNYCARAIVALSMCPESGGKCFNLYGEAFDISRLYRILSAKFPGTTFNRIKADQWQEAVLQKIADGHRYRTLRERLAAVQLVQERKDHQRAGVPIARTREFLEEHCHLPWFEMSDADFIRSVDFMIAQKFLPTW